MSVGSISRSSRSGVGKFAKLTDILKWENVKGPDNPADLLTRGLPAS